MTRGIDSRLVCESDIQRRFGEEGYIHLQGVLSEEQLSEAVANLMRLRPAPASVLPSGRRQSLRGYHERLSLAEMSEEELPAVTRYMRPHLFDAATRRLLFSFPVYKFVQQILGEGALLAHSIYVPKPPGAKGASVHADSPFFSIKPGPCVGVWIAFDDADEGNGAFEVWPGTHLLEHGPPAPSDPSKSGIEVEFAVPVGAERRRLSAKAGDVILFDGNLLHASEPNHSDRWRRAAIGHFASASCVEASEDCIPMYTAEDRLVYVSATQANIVLPDHEKKMS